MIPPMVRNGAVCLVLLCSAFLNSAQAAKFPNVETTLARWGGSKHIVLRSDLADPLSSVLVQDLIELFLRSGFEVSLASAEAPPGDGLVVDVRRTGGRTALVMSRGSDLSILTLQRLGEEEATQSPVQPPVPSKISSTAPPSSDAETQSGQNLGHLEQEPPNQLWTVLPRGPVTLSESPLGVALGGQEDEQLLLALLLDDRLQLVQLSATGVTNSAEFRLPAKPTRGLRLSGSDPDGDGTRELTGLWAEDLNDIYEGTDSKLHSWVFRTRGQTLEPATGDLGSHIRAISGTAYVQKRGEHTLFEGPVSPVPPVGSTQELSQSVPWGRKDLYQLTPLDSIVGLARDELQRLKLVSLLDGEDIPGGGLLEDLGEFRGPQVAIRLETPEFRSGFQKEDRVTETYHYLPPKVAVTNGQTAYTIARGRTPGLPLFGRPSGADSVVRIAREVNTLRVERPFPAVDTFILDFALFQASDHATGVVLLLNDKEDGSGTAQLLIQVSN